MVGAPFLLVDALVFLAGVGGSDATMVEVVLHLRLNTLVFFADAKHDPTNDVEEDTRQQIHQR